MKPTINMIAAVGKNGEIGRKGEIPWRIPSDFKYFKDKTLGHTIVMGRKTWMSLPNRPLKDRRNIVISTTGIGLYGVETYTSLAAAIDACRVEKELWIIGGERLYEEGLKFASAVFLTEVMDVFPDADAFFPMKKLQKNFLAKDATPLFVENGFTFCHSRWVKNV